MQENLSELITQLEEMNKMLLGDNQELANDPERSKKLPPGVKRFSRKKMAFINKVCEIVQENPASALGTMDPGKFIQDVKNLKELTRMMEATAQLQQILEDKLAEQEGTMTQTTTGTL